MEGEPFNQVQKKEEQTSAPIPVPQEKPLPEVSFIPEEFLNKMESDAPKGSRERCALFGMILGGIAVVSWIVILFGVVYSLLGIVLSVIGLKSKRQKWAKIGLGLSVLGLVLSVWYVFAAYSGMVNYNYFTSEFWTTSTTEVVEGVK